MLPSNVSGEVNRTRQASAGQKSNQKQKCQWILTFYSLTCTILSFAPLKGKIAKKSYLQQLLYYFKYFLTLQQHSFNLFLFYQFITAAFECSW